MNKTKRLFLLITAVVALALCFTLGVSAIEESGSLGNNVTYTYDSSTGTVVISGEGATKDYGTQAYYGLSPLSGSVFNHVVIEDGITIIGENVFYDCQILESISVGDSLSEFDDVLFYSDVKSISVSENNEYYSNDEYGVLFNKDKTDLIFYPTSNTRTSYTIPDSVINVGGFAFCNYITEIIMSDNVTNIAEGAFQCCVNLENIKLSSNIKAIAPWTFDHCYKIESIDIPSSVTTIDRCAFRFCVSLKSITIPESVTYLGEDYNFIDCYSLDNIYILNDSIDLSEGYYGYWECPYDETRISRNEFVELFCNYADLCKTNVEEANQAFNELGQYISGNWTPNPYTTIHGYAGSTAETYAKENCFKFEEIKENTTVTVTDSDTNVTAEYDSSVFNGDANLVITPNGKNANIIFNGKFGKFVSYDISFEIDGEKVQPDGNVTIKIPVPDGYNVNATKVFYVDDNGMKTKLESTCADGYIIFKTDHFSEYVLVDESSEITEPSTDPDEPTTEPEKPDEPAEDNCSHLCHKSGFMGFIWKIVRFFIKLFKANPVCDCGIAHY